MDVRPRRTYNWSVRPIHAIRSRLPRPAPIAAVVLVLGAAVAPDGSAAPPLLSAEVEEQAVRSGAGDRITVAFKVQTRGEAERVTVQIEPPPLADGAEPLGSFLREESVRTEGPAAVSLTQVQPDFPVETCVQGSFGPTTSAVLEVPADATASLILRYRVGSVPVGRSPQVRFTATSIPGPVEPVVLSSPPVRVTGRRLPRLALRTTPRTTARGREFRRPPRLAVRGTASRELRGKRVRVRVVSAVPAPDLGRARPSDDRTIGTARVSRAGTFRLRAPFRARRGRAYQLVAESPRTPRLVAQRSCPRRLVVAR